MGRSTEVSAGLLVYRRAHGDLECLLAHPGGPYWIRRDAGAWTIPKGLVENGQDFLSTAKREFQEETGLAIDGAFAPLSSVRQKSGKTVHAFAVEASLDLDAFRSNEFQIEWPPRSGRRATFPEIDRIGYFGFDTAREKIIAYQLPFLDELAEKLKSLACGRKAGTER